MLKTVPRIANHSTSKSGLSESSKANIAAAVLTTYTLAAGYAAINAINEPDFAGAAARVELNETYAMTLKGQTFEAAGVTHAVSYAFPFRGEIEGVAFKMAFLPFSNSSCREGIEIGKATLINGNLVWGKNNREKLLAVVSRDDGKRFCLDQ